MTRAIRTGRLLKEIETKMPGVEGTKTHRVGTKVQVQRSTLDFGLFVVFVGKRYAKLNAIDLPTTIEIEGDAK